MRKQIIFSLVSLWLCLLASSLWATVLKGQVLIKHTPIPIKNATISTQKVTTKTDSNGRFNLTISSPSIVLIVTANGYKTYKASMTITSTTDIRIELELKTVIKASKQQVFANQYKDPLSYYQVSKASIKYLAQKNVFADAVNALKLLPGVASKGSFDSLIYIRGGDGYEVTGIIDNIPIYQPYFFGGRVSIFDSKIAKKIDFFPGGFLVKYGNSLSGVIDVYTIDGTSKKSSKQLDVNLTELHYHQTGSIKKSLSTYMLSYRRTYYDLFAPPVSI